MTSPYSTDAQTVAIGLARKAVKVALIRLIEKQKELETLGASPATAGKIAIIRARLDILGKVETNLLAALQEEYSFLGQSTGSFAPGQLFRTVESRSDAFVESVLQGL